MTVGDWWIVGTVFFCTVSLAPGIDAINKHLRTIIGLLNDKSMTDATEAANPGGV